MKKLILAVFCLALFAGCKKKADRSATISVTGKWTLKKIAGKTYANNKLTSDTVLNVNDNTRYIQFNTDGTGTTTIGNGGTDPAQLVVTTSGAFTYNITGSDLSIVFAGSSTKATRTVTRQNNSLVLHYNLPFDATGKYTTSGTYRVTGEQYYEQ